MDCSLLRRLLDKIIAVEPLSIYQNHVLTCLSHLVGSYPAKIMLLHNVYTMSTYQCLVRTLDQVCTYIQVAISIQCVSGSLGKCPIYVAHSDAYTSYSTAVAS